MKLSVENLCVSACFADGEAFLLKNVDFCIESGNSLAIVGESGSGKTMLALALLGLLPQNCRATGKAFLDGKDILNMRERAKNALRGDKIVYIPQSGAEFLNPALKIKTQIFESLKKSGVKDSLKSAAIEKLALAGLGDEAEETLEKYPHQISGGQAQRVTLALSLCSHPSLVIADEPTKGLDACAAKAVENGIFNLFSSACVVVITHDLSFASRCENILVLKDGRVVEVGDSHGIIANPKEEYTKELIKNSLGEARYA